MSDTSKELKEYIQQLKKNIKALNNPKKTLHSEESRNFLLEIYSRQLKEREVALRGLKVRERVEKAGHNYDEWWQWAMSLYDIVVHLNSGAYLVKSRAREWNDTKEWELPDSISALEKVEQLVGYKMYDRNRGRGDVNKDLKEG